MRNNRQHTPLKETMTRQLFNEFWKV